MGVVKIVVNWFGVIMGVVLILVGKLVIVIMVVGLVILLIIVNCLFGECVLIGIYVWFDLIIFKKVVIILNVWLLNIIIGFLVGKLSVLRCVVKVFE